MKLELKHLAPYLPYGLKIQINDKNNNLLLTYRVVVALSNESVTYEFFKNGALDRLPFNKVKPILRPLSDLTNRINPIQHHTYLDGLSFSKIEFVEKAICNESLFLSDYNYLIEYHFDVFGLIEKNLAIDINTI